MNEFNLTSLIGGCDNLFNTFLVFIIIDYISGILKSIYDKKLNSSIGIKGIVKKVGYILIVIIATLFDNLNGNNMMVRNPIILMFMTNEGISVLENWGSIGLPLPKKIMETLEQLKKENGGNENEKK